MKRNSKRNEQRPWGKDIQGRGAKRRKPKMLESLSGPDALSILKMLAERDTSFAEAIDAAAEELLTGVEVESVAADVRSALESLEPEDVWDRSGRTREGYVEPSEAAWEIFDEALRPFRQELEKYLNLAMAEEADRQCQGILKGIHDKAVKEALNRIRNGAGVRARCAAAQTLTVGLAGGYLVGRMDGDRP